MRKILLGLIILFTAKSFEIGNLNSTAAVLMDGNSGRVLFGKGEKEILANASTTKILTCIIAIENCNLDDVVTVSAHASKMPDVQLNISEGQTFYLEDLLYSMMLESHNDSAVAIAEHVAGNVEKFSELMNEKARELGCYDTNFITPNGLDAENKAGIHSTTAYDLALIMRYCIKNDVFLQIAGTITYSFDDIQGKNSYTVNNKNALLREGLGVIAGKTGYTGKAGYCYVGAFVDDERVYVFSLLGCGWPPSKNLKWADSRKLINYGKENYKVYKYKDVKINGIGNIKIVNGVKEDVRVANEAVGDGGILLEKNNKIEVKYYLPDVIEAPVIYGDVVGRIDYVVDGNVFNSVLVRCVENVEFKSYKWCAENVLNKFFLK